MQEQIQLLTGERQPRETDKAAAACNDYLRLGLGRSLRGLFEHYTQQTSSKHPALNTLFNWSERFDWQVRAAAYDAQVDAATSEQAAEHRRTVLESGLAQDHERVILLKRLADDLSAQAFYEEIGDDGIRPIGQIGRRPYLWIRDVKQIGGGEFAREVTIYRYNSPLISDLRGVLDDLAKETGGRKGQLELTGAGGGPIQMQAFDAALNKTYGPDDSR